MGKMKKYFGFIALICSILILCTVYVSAGELTDNNSSTFIPPIGVLMGLDENGETTSASAAVAVAVENDDAVTFSGLGAFSDNAASYVWISIADEEVYVAEMGQVYDSLGLLGWYVSGAGANPSAQYMANTYEGELATLVYFNKELEFFSANVKSTYLDMIDENPMVTLEGVPTSDILFPAIVINDEGYCTGIVYDSSAMYAVVTNEDNFYVSGQRDSVRESDFGPDTSDDKPGILDGKGAYSENGMYVLIAVVIIVITILIVVFTRKNSKKVSVLQPVNVVQQATPLPPTMPVTQSLYLYGVDGPLNGSAYLLENGKEVLIGRDASACKIHFPGDTKGVSRIHCKLYWKDGCLMLMDLNSSYGTFVENRKLVSMQPVTLKAGDTFYLAEKTNQFKIQ